MVPKSDGAMRLHHSAESAPVPIVEATNNRAAVGRAILRAVTSAVVGGGLLIVQPNFIRPVIPALESSVGHSLVVRAAANGQCLVDLSIGAARLPGGLEDTGASGYLTLGRNQARQVGIDTGRLHFTGTYESANGHARLAETRVAWVRIGNAFDLADLPVAVTEVDQRQALIGIELLRHYNFRLRGDRCELSAPS